MKRISTLLVVAALSACGPGGDPVEEAAVFVAGDLAASAPDGLVPHLGGEWETGQRASDSIAAPVLQRLATATALPVASPEMVSSGGSPIAVLFLFRPEGLAGDTVRVRGGWVGFPNGDGSPGWGEQYEYVLTCTRGCALVTKNGPDPVS
jgi:hypothetical protein